MKKIKLGPVLEIGVIIATVFFLFLLFFFDWNGIERGIILIFFFVFV